MIKELNTFHSGKFVLNTGFDRELSVFSELMTSLGILNKIPAPPGVTAQELSFEKSFLSMAQAGGIDIENEDFSIIYQNKATRKPEEKFITSLNILKCAELVAEKAKTGFCITEGLIKEINQCLLSGTSKESGTYRNAPIENHCLDCTFPTTALDINFLMKNYCDWVNGDDLASCGHIVKGLAVNNYFRRISPFSEYNELIAMILEYGVYAEAGDNRMACLAPVVYNECKEQCNDAFRAFAGDWDIRKVLGVVAENVLIRIKDEVDAIADFYSNKLHNAYVADLYAEKKLNQRQYELVKAMMGGTELDPKLIQVVKPFVSIYKNVSRTTAGRDIAKLDELGLISSSSGGKYKFCGTM